MSKFSIRDLTLAAMLAAVYAVLTMALPIPQYAGVQIRFAEALAISSPRPTVKAFRA